MDVRAVDVEELPLQDPIEIDQLRRRQVPALLRQIVHEAFEGTLEDGEKRGVAVIVRTAGRQCPPRLLDVVTQRRPRRFEQLPEARFLISRGKALITLIDSHSRMLLTPSDKHADHRPAARRPRLLMLAAGVAGMGDTSGTKPSPLRRQRSS
ncbi:hypothetical protein GCM10010151_39440 [Actinoallomurus spadix]|uniref:Uncharacterized protein n=1 Tax=Actinoallomurus spadix TaxID=79912 RepID=A0ABN0WSZ0_9ACTN